MSSNTTTHRPVVQLDPEQLKRSIDTFNTTTEQNRKQQKSRDEHRQFCLTTSAALGFGVAAATTLWAWRALERRPRLKNASPSQTAFGLVLAFFMPFSLVSSLARNRCQRSFRPPSDPE